MLEPVDCPPSELLPACADMLDPDVPRLPDEPAALLADPRLLDEEPDMPPGEPDKLDDPDWPLCDDEPDRPPDEPERLDDPDWPLCEEPALPPSVELPDEPDWPLCCEPERPLWDEPAPCDEPDKPLWEDPEEPPDEPLCCEADEAFDPDELPEVEERTSLPMLVPDSRPWPLPLLPAFDF